MKAFEINGFYACGIIGSGLWSCVFTVKAESKEDAFNVLKWHPKVTSFIRDSTRECFCSDEQSIFTFKVINDCCSIRSDAWG
jgi:hypothetical protein